MKRYLNPVAFSEKCKSELYPLAGQTEGQTLANRGEDIVENIASNAGRNADTVLESLQLPNDPAPTPKSSDKGKQRPHERHRDAHASISHQRPKGKTAQISINAAGSPTISSYPKDGILTCHKEMKQLYACPNMAD